MAAWSSFPRTAQSNCFSVALLEGDAAMRDRLEAALAADGKLALLWTAGSAQDGLAWLRTQAPDVLLVDLDLPRRAGLDVVRSCRARHPGCDIMVSSGSSDETLMTEAFAVGASGYLLKDGSEFEWARHVHHLHAGGSPISPPIARRLLQQWRSSLLQPALPPQAPGAKAQTTRLSAREAEVLALVARGFNHDEVAAQLGLSATTVRTHVRKLYAKLDVHNKTEAVFEARALGLLK